MNKIIYVQKLKTICKSNGNVVNKQRLISLHHAKYIDIDEDTNSIQIAYLDNSSIILNDPGYKENKILFYDIVKYIRKNELVIDMGQTVEHVD